MCVWGVCVCVCVCMCACVCLARYEMPQTGGMGTTSHYAFGILLAAAAVLMYMNKFGPKRQRRREMCSVNDRPQFPFASP